VATQPVGSRVVLSSTELVSYVLKLFLTFGAHYSCHLQGICEEEVSLSALKVRVRMERGAWYCIKGRGFKCASTLLFPPYTHPADVDSDMSRNVRASSTFDRNICSRPSHIRHGLHKPKKCQ
jgi:hypothetical protein